MGRWICFDLGDSRIGIAVSDPKNSFAIPADVANVKGVDMNEKVHIMINAIRDIGFEEEVEGVVVGLPLSLNGSTGRSAMLALETAEMLKTITGFHVETWDERMSSITAEKSLKSAEISAKKRKRARDSVAAAVVLQSFLDSKKAKTDDWES